MACQVSSMRSAGLPIRNGFRYFSTAGIHQVGALREGAAAVAVEAVLVGGDLDDHEPQSGGRGCDHGNVLDLGRRHAARGARHLRLGLSFAPGDEAESRASGRQLQQGSSLHRGYYTT